MENEWQPNPGFCPVEDDVWVDVKFRGTYKEGLFSTDPANEWYWVVDGDVADILYWRIASGN